MTDNLTHKMIEVEIHGNPNDPSEKGYLFRTTDGSPLNAQEMLDAFAEVLLHTDDLSFDMKPETKYDA
jgi:hypothetical protein